MILVRVYVVVLMVGWFAWLVLDKPADSAVVVPGPVAPHGPYALPTPERATRDPMPMPPPEGDAITDFQYAVDMSKHGEFRHAYLTLWERQFWLAAAAVTALLVVLLPPLTRGAKGLWSKRRR